MNRRNWQAVCLVTMAATVAACGSGSKVDVASRSTSSTALSVTTSTSATLPPTAVVAEAPTPTTAVVTSTTVKAPTTTTTPTTAAPATTTTTAPRFYVPPRSERAWYQSGSRISGYGSDTYTCLFRWNTTLVGGSHWLPVSGWSDPHGSTKFVKNEGTLHYYESTAVYGPERARSTDTYTYVLVKSDPTTSGRTGQDKVPLYSPIYTSTGGC
jgi:hypothetical protein